jgi:hypothetical protein
MEAINIRIYLKVGYFFDSWETTGVRKNFATWNKLMGSVHSSVLTVMFKLLSIFIHKTSFRGQYHFTDI